MLKNSFKYSCLLILTVFIFSSCRKDETTGPEITIRKPKSGQQFRVGDTVFVAAEITDERQINSVTVSLLNSNYVSVGTNYTTTVPGNHSDINVHYIIDNQNLATGNYYIEVSASNGSKVTTEFVNIHINEIPRIRKGVYLLSASTFNSFNVSKIDSLHHPDPVITVNGDYSGSVILSASQELFTLGSIYGGFNAFDLNTNTSLWTKPPTSGSGPTFRNLFAENDLVYVSYYDGNIKGYDKTGSQKYQVQQQGYFIPDVLFKNDNYVFGELYYTSFHENRIGVFYLVSGVERQESPIDIDLKSIQMQDQDHLLLFGNDTITGQGKIELYNIAGNGTNLLHTIPTGILYDVARVDNDNYLVSHSGGIHLYDYSMNGLVPFVTGLPVSALTYDDLEQDVFAASGNSVHVYNLITGSEEYSIVNTDSVMDIKVLYNK